MNNILKLLERCPFSKKCMLNYVLARQAHLHYVSFTQVCVNPREFSVMLQGPNDVSSK